MSISMSTFLPVYPRVKEMYSLLLPALTRRILAKLQELLKVSQRSPSAGSVIITGDVSPTGDVSVVLLPFTTVFLSFNI